MMIYVPPGLTTQGLPGRALARLIDSATDKVRAPIESAQSE
jgi:hypothetical protein